MNLRHDLKHLIAAFATKVEATRYFMNKYGWTYQRAEHAAIAFGVFFPAKLSYHDAAPEISRERKEELRALSTPE